MKKLLIFFSLLLVTVISSQEKSPFVRYPSLNNDASKIAFSYQGDIWTVDSKGGEATRLTIHEAFETMPIFSPDGKSIAFTADRMGSNDVFVIPSNGGIPVRLTYSSSNDVATGWENNKEILFSTSREFVNLEREQEFHKVSVTGGTSERILDALGSSIVNSPDNKFYLFVRGSNTIYRQPYAGTANRDIWLFNKAKKSFVKISTSMTNDINPTWGDNQTIYFISAESNGRYNIFRQSIDENGTPTGSAEQITKLENGVRYFDISTNGNSIVFESDSNIYLLDTKTKKYNKVEIELPADYRFDPIEYKTFTSNASGYSVSPNSKYTALVIRGEVFVTLNDKDKSRAVNISNSPYRDTDAAWLNDSSLVFASDRDGQYDLYLAKSDDKSEPQLFKTLKHKITKITSTDLDESNPVISPDGKKITYLRGRGKLIVSDISADGKLSNEKILLDGWATPNSVVWSPDSKYLAYSINDLYFNDEVFIHPIDNSMKPVNVSMHPRGDYDPVWSPDGSKLGFRSERNDRTFDIWFVWLKKSDWDKTKLDWLYEDEKPAPDAKADKGGKDKKDASKDSSKTKDIKIDFDKIYERLVQVTNLPGEESNLAISKDGETFYFTAFNSEAKANDLYSVKWDGKDLKAITKGGTKPTGVEIDKNGKYLYYFKSGALNRIELKGDKSETLPYSAKMTIDHPKEQEQIFEEAWRTIRDGFYDPNFHGYDWDAIKAKYKDWAMAASTDQDFKEMFNYMLGELNSSHMGLYGQNRGETQNESTGFLGIDISPVKGGVKVNRVIPESPADRESSKLFIDDVITSVDQMPVTNEIDFYSLLINKADEPVLLGITDKSGKEREVKIRPISNERQLLYEEWVIQREQLTDKYSNGRLGYIHIQGMNFPSFEVFERQLTAAGHDKEGIVIDVRYNGGGSTTDYLMLVLNYKQHAYTIPRGASDNLEKDKSKFRDYYAIGERLPYSPWIKPSVALCNEDSYSNAEIFSHAYKSLGIGKLVGKPTNGSVISTGGKQLIDGSLVRLPFRAWFTKATDKNQELGPAVPDFIVDNTPNAKAINEDQQLKKAVDELLKQIDSKK